MLATAALAISPGPDNIYVLIQSVTTGTKQGLATTAGLISGCLVHTSLLAFGISIIIKENERLFFTLKFFGALYLFYLAFRVFKSDVSFVVPDQQMLSDKSLWQQFKHGFIMNVLNPKVMIFFLAFFPGFLFDDVLSTTIQFYVLGFLFMAVSFIIFGLIAVLSGSISDYLKNNKNAGVLLKWLQICVFTGIGIYILLSDK